MDPGTHRANGHSHMVLIQNILHNVKDDDGGNDDDDDGGGDEGV